MSLDCFEIFDDSITFTCRSVFSSLAQLISISRVEVSSRRSAGLPSARTAWRTHLLGQTLIVTEGRGWVQQGGQPVQSVRAASHADRVPYGLLAGVENTVHIEPLDSAENALQMSYYGAAFIVAFILFGTLLACRNRCAGGTRRHFDR